MHACVCETVYICDHVVVPVCVWHHFVMKISVINKVYKVHVNSLVCMCNDECYWMTHKLCFDISCVYIHL